MTNAWVMFSTAAMAIVPLLGVPAAAAEPAATGNSGLTVVAAEELNQRSKQPEPGQNGGLSSRGVRNMVFYAFSLIPDELKGPDGATMSVDKSDPNKFFIPEADARAVIRAATRSAYADVCGLPELAEANYETMLAQEKAKQSWSQEQVLMIEALHLFAVSFFTGRASFSEGDQAPGEGGNASADADEVTKAPPPPKCPPEQKQKVEGAINAYVAAAGAQ